MKNIYFGASPRIKSMTIFTDRLHSLGKVMLSQACAILFTRGGCIQDAPPSGCTPSWMHPLQWMNPTPGGGTLPPGDASPNPLARRQTVNRWSVRIILLITLWLHVVFRIVRTFPSGIQPSRFYSCCGP